MTFSKKLLAASVLAALSTSAMAELSANYGATSDYIWRGQPQGGHSSAVFGGVDWDSGSGLTAGMWQSGGVGGSNETDFYAAYGLDAGGIGVEVGFIAYKYMSATAGDFNEIYASADFGMAAAGVYLDSDNKNTYINLSTEISGVGLEVGLNNNDTSAKEYTDVGVSYGLSDELSLGFYTTSGNAAPAADPSGFTITFSKSFSL